MQIEETFVGYLVSLGIKSDAKELKAIACSVCASNNLRNYLYGAKK